VAFALGLVLDAAGLAIIEVYGYGDRAEPIA